MLTRQSDSESIDSTKLPDINSLALFLSRVDRTLRSSSFGTLERIRNLYESGRIHDNENQFLRYFLSQLSLVIEETKETELVVERFVEVCNSYLTLSSDEKSLSLDPQSLRVVVRNSWTNDPISLDDLSSGEKQIVSLMARLHLSPRPKLVLIDEPELSLSLDWQRKVLPDVANSPSVVQLLAITHSPFVFDNELDQYTRSFNISRTENVNVETT
nr:AAA family ATPase [Stenotrophomonas maltophilia]